MHCSIGFGQSTYIFCHLVWWTSSVSFILWLLQSCCLQEYSAFPSSKCHNYLYFWRVLQIKIYQNQKSPWMSEIIFQLCLRFSLFNLSSTVSVISCLTSTEVSATHPYPSPTYKHAYTFAHINKVYVGKYIRKKMLYIMLHRFSRKQLWCNPITTLVTAL